MLSKQGERTIEQANDTVLRCLVDRRPPACGLAPDELPAPLRTGALNQALHLVPVAVLRLTRHSNCRTSSEEKSKQRRYKEDTGWSEEIGSNKLK